MSRSVFVGDDASDQRGFWTYDVTLSVLAAFVLEVDGDRAGAEVAPWSASWRHSLLVTACVPDLGLSIDGVPPESREWVAATVDEAVARAISHRPVTESQARTWALFTESPIRWRGETVLPVEPVVDAGRALAALLRDTLRPPPDGHSWAIGFPGRASLVIGPGDSPLTPPWQESPEDAG